MFCHSRVSLIIMWLFPWFKVHFLVSFNLLIKVINICYYCGVLLLIAGNMVLSKLSFSTKPWLLYISWDLCSLPCRRFFKQLQESSISAFRGNHCLLNLLYFCVKLIGEGLLFLLAIWLKCLRVVQFLLMGKGNLTLNQI